MTTVFPGAIYPRAVYPGGIRAFRSRKDYTDLIYAAHVNDLQVEVAAMENTLGPNPHHARSLGGSIRRYDSVAQRLDIGGRPAVSIEATASAPYTFTRDAVPIIVWDAVRTIRDGVATDAVGVHPLTLPPARRWMASLTASGEVDATGDSHLDFIATTDVKVAHTGFNTSTSTYCEYTTTTSRIYDTDPNWRRGYIASPPGAGWSLVSTKTTTTWYHNGECYYQDRIATYSRLRTTTTNVPYTYYTTERRLGIARTMSAHVEAGQPVGLSTNDATITLPDNTQSDVHVFYAVRGVPAPRLRLNLVSFDTAGLG